MTAKQAEVWALYARGHRVTDIAHATWRSKGAVSTTIKNLKAAMANPREKNRLSISCPYSSSCFTCPLHDCAIDNPNVNLLP